jgi:hypothetical protein
MGATGPDTVSATQAGTGGPAGSPAPVATKKAPGFGRAAAATGCPGVLVLLRKAAK